MDFQIFPERPADAPLLNSLLDRTFGRDRRQRTVYRLRADAPPVAGLRFVAISANGGLSASLRFWPVRIEATHGAVLLGPLAVEPALRGAGIGRALVRHGLARAKHLGARVCLVVGDPAYYGRFGFSNAGEAGLILPGPVAPERFQVLALVPGALDGVSRSVHPASPAAGAPANVLRGTRRQCWRPG